MRLQSQRILFFSKMMGDGYYVAPANGKIYAPAAGTVTTIFPTKHAIGITTPNGLEILLHMGVDTVEATRQSLSISSSKKGNK